MLNKHLTSGVRRNITNQPLPQEFIDLTGKALEKAIKAWEYDLTEERVQPYLIDMTKELPEIKPLISIDNSCVCSVGNISAICGEAKSKKTFLTSALVASAMAMPFRGINNFSNVDKCADINVLWVDTEQGERHVRRVVERISEMTGAKLGGAVSEPRLTTLALRELSPHERKAMMLDAMSLMHYDIVVIDGIADLQRNTNDLEESDALVSELMALSSKCETHIICVLHTNPGSDKARGHLGSSLQRKAETVLFVHRSGEASIVEPQFCRNEPFERFAFKINEEGIPELCPLPSEPLMTVSRPEVVAIVEDYYGGVIERNTLVNKIMELNGVSSKAAQMTIKRGIDRGHIMLDGNRVVVCGNNSNKSNRITGGVTPVTPVTSVTPEVSATETAETAETSRTIDFINHRLLGHSERSEESVHDLATDPAAPATPAAPVPPAPQSEMPFAPSYKQSMAAWDDDDDAPF